jgi:DNA-binding NtrC family response regulator
LGEARVTINTVQCDVMILDQQLPDGHGLSFLEECSREGVELETIVLTAYGDITSAVRAMKSGAYHYLTKPFDAEELGHLVDKAAEVATMRRELRLLREQSGARNRDMIVGETPPMRRLNEMIERVAPLTTTVLITGASGTGKEVVARAIHARSPRAARPFVSTVRRFPTTCSKASCSATRWARSPAPRNRNAA